MPEIKIALYGGKDLDDPNIALVQHLARAFLADPHVVLVSGGIYDPDGAQTSVDLAAYQAAHAYVAKAGQPLEDRFQTWLPERARIGVERMAWGKTRTLHGSPRARRFQLVQGVDALVTIDGEGQTTIVLELAMAVGRVALPIGFSGSDSAESWESDRAFFEQALDLRPALAERLGRPPGSEKELAELAGEVALAVLKKAGRRCLVLMDFTDPGHRAFFEEVVKPAVAEAGFAVHKLDEQESAGDILDLFLTSLDDCHAIIADLTGFNSNVLYELGRVHQHGGLQPLVVVRGGSDTKLPYYISRNLVQLVGKDARRARAEIAKYLTEDRLRR